MELLLGRSHAGWSPDQHAKHECTERRGCIRLFITGAIHSLVTTRGRNPPRLRFTENGEACKADLLVFIFRDLNLDGRNPASAMLCGVGLVCSLQKTQA